MKEGVKKFEDLECWQEARSLVRMVYRLTSRAVFGRNFKLRDQIQAAAMSVIANIAEGFGSFSNAEFARFLRISHRSCLEVQSHLYVAIDNDLLEQKSFEEVYAQANKCAQIIRGFIRYLQGIKV